MDLAQRLWQEGAIQSADLRHVREMEKRWQIPSRRILRHLTGVDPERYLKAYASNYGFEQAEASGLSPIADLPNSPPWKYWKQALAIAVRTPEGKTAIAAVDPLGLPQRIRSLGLPLLVIAEEDWIILAGRCHNRKFLSDAVLGLYQKDPDASARKTFTTGQLSVFWVAISTFLAGLFFAPRISLMAANIFLNGFYLAAMIFKALLTLVGSTKNISQKVTDAEAARIDQRSLPIYTILVPVFKEPGVMKFLVEHLRALDYPLPLLDVKVLLEAGDTETIEAFRATRPPPNFQAIIVPDASPKTKPKACNYGLHFARGEYLTIFDAEDRPDPSQLVKVVAAFRRLPDSVVCIQGCLNYFNSRENFLTKMFTLEYSTLFDYILPGMESLGVPIPLGGTSNHFKTQRLVDLGGWDPYNVTEDADLGVRASAKGFTVATIDTTTYEEANCRYGNWIRQRSRWIKGYMQTFLVHTRRPIKLLRILGARGFTGFLLFVGGTPFIFLASPILLLMFIGMVVTRSTALEPILPTWLLVVSLLNLFLGNFMAVYSSSLAVFRRGIYFLAPYALLNPLYWTLHSVAAYKGLYQLIVKPFYWEKTEHGISSLSPSEQEQSATAHD